MKYLKIYASSYIILNEFINPAMKRKRFKEKIGNKTILIGLTGLAVLLAVSDGVITNLLNFPGPTTTVGQLWRRMMQSQSKSVKEYLAELKETSGYNLNLTLQRLEKKGLIKKVKKEFKPTPVGLQFAESVKNKIVYFDNDNWDKKWRLITFDVPEKQRRDRDWLRSILISHKYQPLHKSVFVGKFPLPDFIYKELATKKLTGYIRLLTIGEIDEEKYLNLI